MNGEPTSVVHVVDGDPAVRDSLTTLLGLNGFEVASYATGGAFLERLADAADRSGAMTREWVVCEADLPDGSGIELYCRMRAARMPAPFVLLVSRRNPSIVRSAQNAGIQQVFQKPLVYRNLISYIGNGTH
ncbi:MAG: response regulator [Pseudomonadales bacterium]